MQTIVVISSFIEVDAYDVETRTLEIRINGNVYHTPCEPEESERFARSDSPGRYYNQSLRGRAKKVN